MASRFKKKMRGIDTAGGSSHSAACLATNKKDTHTQLTSSIHNTHTHKNGVSAHAITKYTSFIQAFSSSFLRLDCTATASKKTLFATRDASCSEIRISLSGFTCLTSSNRQSPLLETKRTVFVSRRYDGKKAYPNLEIKPRLIGWPIVLVMSKKPRRRHRSDLLFLHAFIIQTRNKVSCKSAALPPYFVFARFLLPL